MTKNKKINIFDIYIKLLLLLPITTLFQRFIDPINRLVFMIVFILQFFLLLKKINVKFFALLTFTLTTFCITSLNSLISNFDNMVIYYINWILFTATIITYKSKLIEWINKNKKFISHIVIIWNIIVVISIPFPSSYYVKEAGEVYFGSFTGTVFRLCPTALMIQTLCIILVSNFKDKRFFFGMIVPLYCAFAGSSRTYLVLLILQFMLSVYMTIRNKKFFLLVMIAIIIVMFLILRESSIMQKILYTLDSSNYGDFMFRITSSRSLIWEQILQGFNDYGWFNKLFGGGYKASFSLNTNNVYAHNDFIEILVTFGYVGLISYLISIILFLKAMFKNKKVKLGFYIFCIFIWCFNAMFNQFYNYTCACFSFPFLLVSILLYYDSKKSRKNIKGDGSI